MKRASARRTRSPGAGRRGEPGPGHPGTNARSRPISSAPSVPSVAHPWRWGAALVLPRCNTQTMQWHLDEISSQVSPRAHAVLFADQARWHTTAKLVIPPNITLLLLPPRSPELNPVENIWQFMRDNWLSNRVFKSYDDIVALCCEAWNKLIDQPWTIMSIGQRKWAHGF